MVDGTDGTDIEATGLLDGLEGDARAERNELIGWLLERGFSADEVSTAVSPMLLPAGRLMGDDGTRLSANQICADTGLELELLQALQRALGLSRVDDPDAAVHLRADADAAARATGFLELGLSAEQVVAVARVLGQGLAPAAEVMRQAVLDAVLRPGTSEMQIAQEYEVLVRQIAPLLAPMLDDVLRLHLRHGLETEAVNAAERAAGALPGARDVTVAFADLVGFTRLGEAVPPEELELLASRLADLARDVAAAPVRFVKTIGDAVMFVSPDTSLLLDAMVELVGAAESDDFPSLRVGVASGSAISRAGDWFGSPVNLASRVTGVARPGAVLVTEPVREAVGDAERFTWSFAGARHLKGVRGDVKLFRARRSTG